MWNYVTYRDAIAVLGLDAADDLPGGLRRGSIRRSGPTSGG